MFFFLNGEADAWQKPSESSFQKVSKGFSRFQKVLVGFRRFQKVLVGFRRTYLDVFFFV